MKPPGIRLTARDGIVGMHAVLPSRIEDKVWDAVQEAIAAGWTPKQFIAEAREAWAAALKESAKATDAEFSKEKP